MVWWRGSPSSFCMWKIHFSWYHLLKRLFSSSNCVSTFVLSELVIHVRVSFLRFQFYSIYLYICVFASTHWLDSYSFAVNFKIGKCESYKLVNIIFLIWCCHLLFSHILWEISSLPSWSHVRSATLKWPWVQFQVQPHCSYIKGMDSNQAYYKSSSTSSISVP